MLVEPNSMPQVVADGVVGLAMPELSHTGTTFLQQLQRLLGVAAGSADDASWDIWRLIKLIIDH